MNSNFFFLELYHWESLEELLLESVDITSTSSAVWFLVSMETLPCPPTVMWISPDGCHANWFCCDVGSSETSPLVYFKQGQQCHWHLENLSPNIWRERTPHSHGSMFLKRMPRKSPILNYMTLRRMWQKWWMDFQKIISSTVSRFDRNDGMHAQCPNLNIMNI
jgi:hypothetical protein